MVTSTTLLLTTQVKEVNFFFFCEVGPNRDPRTQACWPIALYLSFKYIGGYLEVQPPYRGLWSRSASPTLFVLDLSWQSRRSASLPFPTPCICVECVTTFPFLHRISCMRESLLSSSCAACTADWYARLGALSTLSNVSCPVYLWTEHPNRWSLQTPLAGPILFTDFPFCLFPFFNPISYFRLKPA